MGVVLPFARHVRYLSGLDWVISALDCSMKKATGAGNSFQVVMVFDSRLDESVLIQKLPAFLAEFPLISGKVDRNLLNLAPYWKYSCDVTPGRVPINVRCTEDSLAVRSVLPVMEECVNRPFNRDDEHLAFHLVHTADGKSCLIATFDHKLFDARGAEVFLKMLHGYLVQGGDDNVSDGVGLTAPSGLSEWGEKFLAGQVVNRRFMELSGNSSRTLPEPGDRRRPFRFRLVSFDRERTAAIFDRAYKEAGFLMEMPYLLAVTAEAMHVMFERKHITGPAYVVPVTVDTRAGGDERKEVFFNYSSFLFFQLLADRMAHRGELIREIKRQMYEQVEMRFPKSLAEASMLMRIVPLPILGWILKRFGRESLPSFSVAYLGKCAFEGPEFMGQRVENVFHMPRIPTPPGIGVFFNVYGGCLNASISWVEGLVTEEEIEMLGLELRSRL